MKKSDNNKKSSFFKNKDIISIILGIIALILISGLFGALAIYFGYRARKEGDKYGIIGLILGIIVVLIYVVIKSIQIFLGYLPLRIMEACSMYHGENLDNWWETHEEKYSDFGITKQDFDGFELKNGFSKGDIVFIIKAEPESLKIGDVIMFTANQNRPVIHRIIKIEQNDIDEYVFSTIGDNNNGQLVFEKEINQEYVLSKTIFKIPYWGWPKLIFYESKQHPSNRGLCNQM